MKNNHKQLHDKYPGYYSVGGGGAGISNSSIYDTNAYASSWSNTVTQENEWKQMLAAFTDGGLKISVDPADNGFLIKVWHVGGSIINPVVTSTSAVVTNEQNLGDEVGKLVTFILLKKET